jgi:uncharacterized protein
MLIPTIKVRILAGSICLLLLVIYDSTQSASAAQSSSSNNNNNTNNNNNNNPVLKAIQEAFLTDSRYLKAKVTVKDLELNADVPTTSELMSKGLAVKNELKENEAMLFIFEESAKHSFWMKDMKFPIDILWLDSASKVVHIERNLQPCASVFICTSCSPSVDSQYVLETVAGFAQRHDVKLGSDIDFELVR